MAKKIIFVGLPKAGKTTLRKIFFEGEDASKFSLDLVSFKTEHIETIFEKRTLLSFLGFMIADKDGKTLVKTEVFEGVFDLCLKSEYRDELADPELILR